MCWLQTFPFASQWHRHRHGTDTAIDVTGNASSAARREWLALPNGAIGSVSPTFLCWVLSIGCWPFDVFVLAIPPRKRRIPDFEHPASECTDHRPPKNRLKAADLFLIPVDRRWLRWTSRDQ